MDIMLILSIVSLVLAIIAFALAVTYLVKENKKNRELCRELEKLHIENHRLRKEAKERKRIQSLWAKRVVGSEDCSNVSQAKEKVKAQLIKNITDDIDRYIEWHWENYKYCVGRPVIIGKIRILERQ